MAAACENQHAPLAASHLQLHTRMCRHFLDDIAALQADYSALMYGGVSATQRGSRFDKPSPANAFASSAFSYLFYR